MRDRQQARAPRASPRRTRASSRPRRRGRRARACARRGGGTSTEPASEPGGEQHAGDDLTRRHRRSSSSRRALARRGLLRRRRRSSAGRSSGRRRRGRPSAPGVVVAAIMRPPSRTTKTLPSSVAASSWATSGPQRLAPASTSRFAPLGEALGSGRVGQRSSPSPSRPRSTTTTSATCGEISVRSASAWAASMACEHTAAREASPEQVLRRPRHAPGRDDRVLRAPLVRAAALPRRSRCSGSSTRPTRARSSCASCSKTFPSTSLDSILRAVRGDPGERDRARHRRRRVPALVVALVLQRARERVQHRLRPAEPRLPARQGARDDDDGRLARRRCSRRSSSARSAQEILKRYLGLRRQREPRARARDRRLDASGIFVFLASAYYVLTNVDLTCARCCPGAVDGGGDPRGDVPAAARCTSTSRSTTRCCRRSRARRSCSSGST